MKRIISCPKPAHIFPWPIPNSEVNLSSILTIEPIDVFTSFSPFKQFKLCFLARHLALTVRQALPRLTMESWPWPYLLWLVQFRLFIWQISIVVRLHPQIVKFSIRPTTRDQAARKYSVCFILSLFSDIECIRPSSKKLDLHSCPIVPDDLAALTLVYSTRSRTKVYISLPRRFSSTCLHYSRYDCPP